MQPIIAGTSDLRLTDAGRAAVTEEARRALMDRLDVIAARTAQQIEETGSLGERIELRLRGLQDVLRRPLDPARDFDAIEAVIRKVVPRPAPRLLTYEPETALRQ